MFVINVSMFQQGALSPDTTNLKMEAVYSNFSDAKEIKENQKKIAERLEVDKWGIPANMNIFGNQQISWGLYNSEIRAGICVVEDLEGWSEEAARRWTRNEECL